MRATMDLVASDHPLSGDVTNQGLCAISRGVIRLLQPVEVMSSITPGMGDFMILV